MSFILQLGSVIWSQSFSSGAIAIPITNSGTENVTAVKLKVIDSLVFTSLSVGCLGGYRNCLNTFTASKLNFINGVSSFNLEAGQTRNLQYSVAVKAGAPVQVHNIACDFTYEVY